MREHKKHGKVHYAVRTDHKHKGMFRIVRLKLTRNNSLRQASTIVRGLTKEEAWKQYHILNKTGEDK